MRKPPSVETICREHGISRQAYYQSRQREKETIEHEEEALKAVKKEREQQAKLGTRKLYDVFYALFRRLKIGRDKLFDLLRRKGLLVRRRRRSIATTNWRHSLHRYANLIKDFVPKRPNQLWVSDMTYIRLDRGFAYASLVTDAFSRKIVGYHLAETLETQGPLRALKMALKGAASTERLIHHSDQGVQYCSKEYIEALQKHDCKISMTGGGNPYENALAERVNGILKHEYALGESFRSFAQTDAALKEAVMLYNERRPHLSLAYERPADVHARGYLKAA